MRIDAPRTQAPLTLACSRVKENDFVSARYLTGSQKYQVRDVPVLAGDQRLNEEHKLGKQNPSEWLLDRVVRGFLF